MKRPLKYAQNREVQAYLPRVRDIAVRALVLLHKAVNRSNDDAMLNDISEARELVRELTLELGHLKRYAIPVKGTKRARRKT